MKINRYGSEHPVITQLVTPFLNNGQTCNSRRHWFSPSSSYELATCAAKLCAIILIFLLFICISKNSSHSDDIVREHIHST